MCFGHQNRVEISHLNRILGVHIPRGDTGCSSRDVQSRSLSIVFALARCRARSVQGIEACPHRARGLCRSVHSTELVPEQEKPRTDSGAGWMMLICFQATKFSSCLTTKTGLNTNMNHPRQKVPTVQTPCPKELYFLMYSRPWNYSDLCKLGDAQRICDHDGFFLAFQLKSRGATSPKVSLPCNQHEW